MKNKLSFCGFIIVIMAFLAAFGSANGYTNARYFSAARMTGDSDNVKTVGGISIYHPDWVYGYTGPDDGSGFFAVSGIPIEYGNIHYRVTNKADDKINEEEASCYIRIAAEDGSGNIPIEYDVHEYDTPGRVLPLEEGIGYGPFTLSAGQETEQWYSIRANWISNDSKYLSGIQYLKVQMVKKRGDGKTLNIIDEAPLNMKYTGSGSLEGSAEEEPEI